MNSRLNKHKYPGAKRLMLEALELKDNTEDYCAQPIDDNLFEWHFTVRGPPDTAFDGGFYHGYHPETWQPSWSVRTALLALIAFMPTKANRAIGSLDFSDAERKKLALKSRTWRCETCGLIKDLLVQPESVVIHNNNSSIDCEPGTSTSDDSSGSDRLSESKDSNYSGEDRDISTDSSGSKSSNSDSDNSIDTQEGASVRSNAKLKINSIKRPSSAPAAVSYRRNEVDSQTLQRIPNHRRRAYPPLVFKSIFILLSLLILRRVVMVIQS